MQWRFISTVGSTCFSNRGKLLAMLQAQEMDGVRRRLGKERNSELGECFKVLVLFFHATHCLAPGWFKTMLFFQGRFSPSNLLTVQLFHFVA